MKYEIYSISIRRRFRPLTSLTVEAGTLEEAVELAKAQAATWSHDQLVAMDVLDEEIGEVELAEAALEESGLTFTG